MHTKDCSNRVKIYNQSLQATDEVVVSNVDFRDLWVGYSLRSSNDATLSLGAVFVVRFIEIKSHDQ